MRTCSQLRAGDMRQRMKIQAIYGPKTNIHAEASVGDPEEKHVLHADDAVCNDVLEQTSTDTRALNDGKSDWQMRQINTRQVQTCS